MKYRRTDLSQLKTYSIEQREHKTHSEHKYLPAYGATVAEFLNSLPNFLAVKSFNKLVDEIKLALRSGKPVVAAMGAHVIKAGCGPIIIDMIQKGMITAISCNGAFAIHDIELALFGNTSECVESTILDGRFGMVQETIDFFDEVLYFAESKDKGLGESIGEIIENRSSVCLSVFLAARKADIPICVHVALGTDTIHMSDLNFKVLAQSSMRDFELICDVVSHLGVWMNIGSSVILPEVFLKAVSVARNLGSNLDDLFTANFDMIQHYRPHQNVVTRPVSAGRGVEITGHHEIMLPLLRQALVEKLF